MNAKTIDTSGRPPGLRHHAAALTAAVLAFLLLVMGANQAGALASGAVAGIPGTAFVGIAGLFTTGLAVVLSRTQPRLAGLGWAASGLLLFQFLLVAGIDSGRLSPQLAPIIRGTSLLFFLALAHLVVATAPRAGAAANISEGARRLALVAALVLTTQMLLGAIVRQGTLSGATWLADLQGLHRAASLLTLAFVSASSISMARAATRKPWLRGLAVAVAAVLLGQLVLGAASRSGNTQSDLASAHIGLGVALLACQWGLYFAATVRLSPATLSHQGFSHLARQVLALAKPRVTVMVVFTFAGGLFLAPQSVVPAQALFTLLGTVLIVAAANALNMYLERDIDGRMQRTRNRPLPAAQVTPETALAAGTVFACLAIPMLFVAGNALTAVLGIIAFASYVFLYTPLKQSSSIALWVGAVPGAMPPLMGWTAASNHLDAPGLLLFAVLFSWQIPHFIAISVMRQQDYVGAGFKIVPDEFGDKAARWNSIVFAFATVLPSLALPFTGIVGWPFGILALALGIPFITRSADPRLLTQPHDPVVDAIAKQESPTPRRRWARRLFGWSIVYLMLLFFALGVDRGLAQLFDVSLTGLLG